MRYRPRRVRAAPGDRRRLAAGVQVEASTCSVLASREAVEVSRSILTQADSVIANAADRKRQARNTLSNWRRGGGSRT